MKTITAPPRPSGSPDLFAAAPSFRPFDRDADRPLPGLFVPVTYRPFSAQPAEPLPAEPGYFWSFTR